MTFDDVDRYTQSNTPTDVAYPLSYFLTFIVIETTIVEKLRVGFVF